MPRGSGGSSSSHSSSRPSASTPSPPSSSSSKYPHPKDLKAPPAGYAEKALHVNSDGKVYEYSSAVHSGAIILDANGKVSKSSPAVVRGDVVLKEDGNIDIYKGRLSGTRALELHALLETADMRIPYEQDKHRDAAEDRGTDVNNKDS